MLFECATKESNSTLCVTNQQINVNSVVTRFLQLMKYFRSHTVLFNTLLCRLPLCLYVYGWPDGSLRVS